MHDASPPRTRLFVSLAAFLVAGAAALADDGEPAYFSERFGGQIERVVAGPDGTIYVAGQTSVADLPASTSTPDPGEPDYERNLFFVAALERDGRPRWTSYAAGHAFQWTKSVRGLAVAPDGSVWMAGVGYVDPVPYTPPTHFQYYSDVVLVKFAADGTLLFAVNLGGELDDLVSDLAVAADGDVIVAGRTRSDDFPGAPRPVPAEYGRTDAFVARVRGDGSETAWVRRYGGDGVEQDLHGCSVVIDPADGTILVGLVDEAGGARAPVAGEIFPPPGVRVPRNIGGSRAASVVIRLTAAGDQLQGARLPFLGSQVRTNREDAPLALLPGGKVLVGGAFGVARVDPILFLGADAAWVHPWRWSVASRICPDPAGRVVVAERVNGYEIGLRISVREPDLADGEAPVDRAAELGFRPADIAVDADGSLLVVGYGDAATFGAPFQTAGPATGCIARVPLDGVRGPTRLRAHPAGPREADLVWSRDGDAATGFDIESVRPDWQADAAPRLVAHADGDVSRFRTPGLTPGSYEGIRVVAVFASGVRSASPVRFVSMPPVPATDLVATEGPGQAVDLQWTSANGDTTWWEIQRRFGDGPWMDTNLYSYAITETRVTDVVPDVTVPVRYRVRARWNNRRTAWIESAPVLPESSLRVEETRGFFDPLSPSGYVFYAEGTFARPQGLGSVPFDPATQDLQILYGYAVQPDRFTLPHGDPGWTFTNGVATWRAQDASTGFEPGSEVVLDIAFGTFSIRLQASYLRGSVEDRSVAVNLAFGEYSGGDVRRWEPVPGSASRLVLR